MPRLIQILHYKQIFLVPLQELNENAATLFKSGEENDVEEGVTVMNDCVIPCMHLMVRDSITQEDMDAIDTIRSHWCSYLGQNMDGEPRTCDP